MSFARESLLWCEKPGFARFCPKVGEKPENPRAFGSIPPGRHKVTESDYTVLLMPARCVFSLATASRV